MSFPVEALLAATEHVLFEDEDDSTRGGTIVLPSLPGESIVNFANG